jgi:hypothetical protein
LNHLFKILLDFLKEVLQLAMVEVVDMAMMMDTVMAMATAEMMVTASETEITAMMYLE